MKKTSIVLTILGAFCSHIGFADSILSSETCCPTSSESVSSNNQMQQMQLDKIQSESEEITGSNTLFINDLLQKAIAHKMKNSASLDSIQKETEGILVQSLQDLSGAVTQHLSKTTEQAHQ